MNTRPVVRAASLFLFHTPDLVRYGSKPRREIEKDPQLLHRITTSLRTYDEAVAYRPNQVFVGARALETLWDESLEPWYQNPDDSGAPWGQDGRIVPQAEFYLLLKASDEFKLVDLDGSFIRSA